MPEVHPHPARYDNHTCLQTLPRVPGRHKCSPLKTTVSFRFLIKKPEKIKMFYTFQVQRLMNYFVNLFATKTNQEEKKKTPRNNIMNIPGEGSVSHYPKPSSCCTFPPHPRERIPSDRTLALQPGCSKSDLINSTRKQKFPFRRSQKCGSNKSKVTGA